MSTEVINTVQVQAAAGRSDELGKQLQRIVETLRQQPGCESYMVDRCPEDSNRWNVKAARRQRACIGHGGNYSFTIPGWEWWG